jgi:ABC-type multidrug transport system fused ATPase/permease subunit
MYDVISKWDMKENTYLTRYFENNGKELSGGQLQKIALARAFYKDSDFVILDEPSSALDAQAEDYIFQKTMEICNNKTALFISHRLSTTSLADYILYIEDGVVAERGSHLELLYNNGSYSKLYKMQAEKYQINTEEEVG